MSFRRSLKSLCKSLSGGGSTRRPKKARAQLRIESLEERRLMAASVLLDAQGNPFLNVDGSAAADILQLSVDPANAARFQVITTSGGLTSTQTFDRTVLVNGLQRSVDLVKMDGKGGIDTIIVRKVLQGVRVEATTDSADTLSVGDGGRVNDINGDVVFKGNGTLVVDDVNSGLARQVALSATEVQFQAAAGFQGVTGKVKFNGASPSQLTIVTSSGADVITVSGTPAGAATTLRTGAGADQITVLGTTGALTIESGTGNDAITVGSAAASLDAVRGKVTVKGQGDSDTLTVNDLAALTTPPSPLGPFAQVQHLPINVTIDNDSVTRNRQVTFGQGLLQQTVPFSATIEYDAVENLFFNANSSVALNPGGIANVINVEGLSAAQTTVTGSSRNDAISISPTARNLDNVSGNPLSPRSLSINAGLGADQLTLNDQNAPASFFGVGVSITDQSVTRSRVASLSVFGQLTASISYDAVEQLTYNAATNSANTVSVLSTKLGTPTTVNGGSASDTFRLGKADKGLDDLKGAVVINGGANGASGDQLILDDLKSAAAQTYTVTSTKVTRAGVDITYGTVESVTLNASERGSTVNVESTSAPLTVQLAGPRDVSNVVNVSPTARTLNAIAGALDVRGSDGLDQLFVFDQNSPAPSPLGSPRGVVTVTDRLVTRQLQTVFQVLGQQTIVPGPTASIRYSAVDELTFNASNLPNVISVQSTASGTITRVNGGLAGDIFTLGSDAKGLDDVKGGVFLNGLGGADNLTVNDKAAAAGRVITLSTFTLGNALAASGVALIAFDTIESMVFSASDHNDTFTLLSAPANPVTFKGNGGSDKLVGPNQANVFTISDNNKGDLNGDLFFESVENLTGGSQADAFKFANGKGLTGKIDGLAGRDTLDFSAYTTSVTVDLTQNRATNVFAGAVGGIANIENAFGGSAGDTLVGNALANILVGNGGADDLQGRGGRDLMIGGNGQDTLVANGDGVINGLDESILIGGRTSFDANLAALEAVLAEWTSARDFDTRVLNILGVGTGPRANGNTFLKFAGQDQTVFGDNATDLLTRNEDRTLYFKDAADSLVPNARANDQVIIV